MYLDKGAKIFGSYSTTIVQWQKAERKGQRDLYRGQKKRPKSLWEASEKPLRRTGQKKHRIERDNSFQMMLTFILNLEINSETSFAAPTRLSLRRKTKKECINSPAVATQRLSTLAKRALIFILVWVSTKVTSTHQKPTKPSPASRSMPANATLAPSIWKPYHFSYIQR